MQQTNHGNARDRVWQQITPLKIRARKHKQDESYLETVNNL